MICLKLYAGDKYKLMGSAKILYQDFDPADKEQFIVRLRLHVIGQGPGNNADLGLTINLLDGSLEFDGSACCPDGKGQKSCVVI